MSSVSRQWCGSGFELGHASAWLSTRSVAHSETAEFGDSTSAEAVLSLETWLILPVVICLSQRLSHACLRISFDESANGSLKQ